MSETPGASAPASQYRDQPRRWGRSAILLVLSLMALAFVAELCSRLLLPALEPPIQREFRVNTRRDRVPFVMFGTPPYNGPIPDAVKPPGEYRAIMLGGSTVEHGDPPVPACLEQTLKKAGVENIRVFNYGVVAANSGNELARLVHEVLDLKPDLVIFYDGANDMNHPINGDPRPGYSFDHLVYEANPLLSPSVREYPWFSLLLYSSDLMRRCCKGYFVDQFIDLKTLRAEVGYGTDPWRRQIAKKYVGNIVKARQISEGVGARFISFFQAQADFKEPRTEAEEEMTYKHVHAITLRDMIREEIHLARTSDLLNTSTAVDLSDVFDGVTRQVFWNKEHVEQFARWIVAEGMLRHLLPVLRNDPRVRFAAAHTASP